MITVLHLDATTTALCLAAVAVVWTLLFLKPYKEHQRRNAVKGAYWWHRYMRAYNASCASRHPVEPVRQLDKLEAAAAAGAFSGTAKGQEKESR
jgi:hypothetical protein